MLFNFILKYTSEFLHRRVNTLTLATVTCSELDHLESQCDKPEDKPHRNVTCFHSRTILSTSVTLFFADKIKPDLADEQ